MLEVRKRQRGRSIVYQVRGQVPIRQADGSIRFERIERSARTGDIKAARIFAGALERQYYADVECGRPRQSQGFAEAALIYMRTSGVTRYIAPLLDYFRDTPIADIDQAAAVAAAATLYPGCAPQTINRQVFTPLLAILNLAARTTDAQKPKLVRPAGHDHRPEIHLPDDDWYARLLPHCKPELAALILFLSAHGRRIQDALGRTPRDLDPKRWVLTVGTTKAGVPIEIPLADPVIAALDAYDWRLCRWLFRYADRNNVYRDLKRICRQQGLDYHAPHTFGRHAFAGRWLKAGGSLKGLQQAGHWATIQVPAQRYGHMERRQVDDTVRDLGREWGDAIGRSSKSLKLNDKTQN